MMDGSAMEFAIDLMDIVLMASVRYGSSLTVAYLVSAEWPDEPR